jgi:hypothetical protein
MNVPDEVQQRGQQAMRSEHLELAGRVRKIIGEPCEAEADVLEHFLVVVREKTGELGDSV